MTERQPMETAPKDGTPIRGYFKDPTQPRRPARWHVMHYDQQSAAWKIGDADENGVTLTDPSRHIQPTGWAPLAEQSPGVSGRQAG